MGLVSLSNRSPEIAREDRQANVAAVDTLRATTISFAEDVDTDSKALYIPPPRERDRGICNWGWTMVMNSR